LAIDDETYRRARIVAAERNIRVSALVRAYLKDNPPHRQPRQLQRRRSLPLWTGHGTCARQVVTAETRLTPADVFVDANALSYAASTDPEEVVKRELVRRLLARPDWGLFVRVMQELCVNLIRRNGAAMPHDDAVALIRKLLRRMVVISDRQLLLEALRRNQRFQVSY
jgi:predicted nucleic acid-binding protein